MGACSSGGEKKPPTAAAAADGQFTSIAAAQPERPPTNSVASPLPFARTDSIVALDTAASRPSLTLPLAAGSSSSSPAPPSLPSPSPSQSPSPPVPSVVRRPPASPQPPNGDTSHKRQQQQPAAAATAAGKSAEGENNQPLAESFEQSAGEEANSFWERQATFRPRVSIGSSLSPAQVRKKQQFQQKCIKGSDFVLDVRVPDGEDRNEWIAVNTTHFYNAVNSIYGFVADFCSPSSCPIMSAGKAEYLWKDPNDSKYSKPTRLPAPLHIDLMLNWISLEIADKQLFPDDNSLYPRDYMSRVSYIYKRLFRVYAHIYYHHLAKLQELNSLRYVNTSFKHFVCFVLEFGLLPDPSDTQPLSKFVSKIRSQRWGSSTSSSSRRQPAEQEQSSEPQGGTQEADAERPKQITIEYGPVTNGP